MKNLMLVLPSLLIFSSAFAAGNPANPYAFCYRGMLTNNGGLVNAPKVPTDVAKGLTMQENGNLVVDPDPKGVIQVYTRKGLVSVSGASCSIQTDQDKTIDAKLGGLVKTQYQTLQDLLKKAQAGNDKNAVAQYSGTLKIMQTYCAFLNVLPKPGSSMQAKPSRGSGAP